MSPQYAASDKIPCGVLRTIKSEHTVLGSSLALFPVPESSAGNSESSIIQNVQKTEQHAPSIKHRVGLWASSRRLLQFLPLFLPPSPTSTGPTWLSPPWTYDSWSGAWPPLALDYGMMYKDGSELCEKPVGVVDKDVEHVFEAEYPHGFVKKTIRQVDRHMLPLLGLLYAVALIDRTNLGIARIAGMEKDLELKVGSRYSIASSLYFVPYILLQLPSNIILRVLGARTWLTICVIGWGASQLGMGFVPTWGYLVLCRLFLGVFEAGFFPALVFIITTWYKRHEVQKRLAFFYLFSILLGGFSAIFAYTLTLIAPRGGLNGWQWIFIIEGIITIVLGILTYVFVADFPDKNRFLTEEQTKLVLHRVEKDRGDSLPDKMTWRKLCLHLSDWTMWAYAMMFLCATTPAYAIGFFITIILASMGFNVRDSLLLSAPPNIFAAICTFGFAYISDRTQQRALLIAVQTVLTIVGLVVTSYAHNNGARYFGLFIAYAGASACIPGILSYNANNVVSHTKRAVSTAIIVAFGGIGGIFATTVFREQDYPRYINGIWATIGCQSLMLVLLAMLSRTYNRRNKLAREGKMGPLEGQPGFYYTI
ncbi:putative high-affinity nicotinic acid transporter [Lyophyllum shimeji]|uniref:High-affinity nicotinic acid transporter n=1 Tax=Lyophyllum shimeji TaxID=47721 RepID=A0A9P3UNS1_LYOSH|nr:putative high-affinity nicotinic acid transporter [Lyophyllum shimeji]